LLRALGLKRKLRLGPWFTPVLAVLRRMKRLRGTPLDFFGYAAIRRRERALIGWYRETVQGLLPTLDHENHALAVAIADSPDDIRGYEEIKERNIRETQARVSELLARYRAPAQSRVAG
jgi:indolepyruvate ferredoxin oxidoreductase